jgi:hypothetical protein
MNVENAVTLTSNSEARPVEITNAIRLVGLNFLIGWSAMLISWDYFTRLYSSPTWLITNQVLSTAILVWIYYKIYQGRNWARIVLAVMSVLGFAMYFNSTFTDLLASMPTVAKASTAVGVVVNLSVLWLLFFSKGRHWFQKQPSSPVHP